MTGWQYYWNPWFRERHVYFAAFEPGRCRDLLKENTTIWLGARVGRRILTGDDVWLYRVSLGTNASKPYARIRCRPAPGGSSVEVTIGLRPAGRIGFAVWFGFIGLFTLSSFTNIVSSSWWEALIGLLLGAAFLGSGSLLFAFGRLLARRDPGFLLGHIRGRLAITDQPGAEV